MKTTMRQSVRRRGAALVLAVVVTVLLAVVGVMFVMVARVGEMQTSSVIDNSDLDTAVQSVSTRIQQTLTDDLFRGGDTIGNGNPHYNWPGVKKGGDPAADERINPWLASLEPDVAASQWVHITDLTDDTATLSRGVAATIIPDYQNKEDVVADKAADADGDGVADSRWIQLPNTFTSRGKPVFAAVRIIDNCAMLNLNTAFGFYQQDNATPWHSKSWYAPQLHLIANLPYETNGDFGKSLGRYLSEVNYTPFLRGDDRNHIEYLMLARDPIRLPLKPAPLAALPDIFHNEIILHIESPGSDFTLFDFSDELEMRNRFLLTTLAQVRFEREGVAYNTFDWGRGEFVGGWNVALRVKRTPCENADDLNMWQNRLNPYNFDDTDPANLTAYYYGRRHISTFYSFDRPLRTGAYPLLDTALVALQASLVGGGMTEEQAQLAVQTAESYFRPLNNRPLDLRTMTDPADADGITANTLSARRNILHLLYAFQAFYMENGLTQPEAAKRSTQIVANLIDYFDDNSENTGAATETQGPFYDAAYQQQANKNCTFLNKAIIDVMVAEVSASNPNVVGNVDFDFGLDASDTIYGYEHQPFISEVYTEVNNDAGGVLRFAVELVNPYDKEIDLSGWRFLIEPGGASGVVADGTLIAPDDHFVFCSHAPSDPQLKIAAGADYQVLSGFLIANTTQTVYLQRPANADFVNIECILRPQIEDIIADPVGGLSTYHSSKRDDNGWAFTNCKHYEHSESATNTYELGSINSIAVSGKGYQLPLANSGTMERLTDFLQLALIGNQKGGVTPMTITEQIADAATEAEIRFDIETAPEVLDYVCFLNRPQGSLPGRININTAAVHVIAAAIPPQLVMTVAGAENALTLAQKIVDNRPYERVSDLLIIDEFRKFAQPGSPNVGDAGIENDFEERDWIVSRLANIFTVRSDTFTAYLLVRLGADGPQRRMIAIFDRTNVWTKDDRPRLVALHPVADPR